MRSGEVGLEHQGGTNAGTGLLEIFSAFHALPDARSGPRRAPSGRRLRHNSDRARWPGRAEKLRGWPPRRLPSRIQPGPGERNCRRRGLRCSVCEEIDGARPSSLTPELFCNGLGDLFLDRQIYPSIRGRTFPTTAGCRRGVDELKFDANPVAGFCARSLPEDGRPPAPDRWRGNPRSSL